MARSQLSGASNQSLAVVAAQGGWRKGILDVARLPLRSWIDFPRLLGCLGGVLVIALPPFGNAYRRAIVAQSILDGKSSQW